MIPAPWVALVLTLAAFRVVRLIGWDDLPPIYRLRARATGERVRYSLTESRDPIYSYDRPLLAHFLSCAFCQGFWASLAVYGTWVGVGSPGAIEPRSWAFYGLVPLALSGAVGLIAKNLDA